MSNSIYLNLKDNPKDFKQAKQKAIDAFGDDTEDKLLWENLEITNETAEFDGDDFSFSGDLINTDTGNRIGYLSISRTFELDDALNVIDIYVKKLNKLKTMMEAVK